jgi:uncharacterized protein YqfA (UPF0365 family)
MNTIYILIISIVGLYIFLYLVPLGLYMQAKLSGVEISMLELIFMRLRKVPPSIVVNALIVSNKAELKVSRSDLEALYLSGGSVENVVHGLIMAKKSDISLNFEEACKVDRKGYNVVEVIENEIRMK